IVDDAGIALTAKRARPKADFLASTDTWFRPASLATGPDGALYLADMYRLWVEHPKFLPPDVAKKLDWRAGEDRGRIYRIVPTGATSRRFTPPESTADRVKLLRDANGWRRQLGQRLLVERRDKDAAPALRRLFAGRNRVPHAGLTRLHALWTLDGIGALKSADLKRALRDPDEYVRRDAVKLLGRQLKTHPSRSRLLETLAEDPSIRVRFEVALALGETDHRRAADLLARLAARDGGDRWFRTAVLTSAKDRAGAILSRLVKNAEFSTRGDAGRIDLVRRLATVVGTRGDERELAALLKTVTASSKTGVWWQTAALSGLAAGLPRHRGKLGRTSLQKLVASPTKTLAGPMLRVKRLLEQIARVALDGTLPIDDRVAAIGLLAYRPADQSAAAFEQLLSTSQPVDLQLACLDAMQAAGGNERMAAIVLKRWRELGPSARGPAIALLLRRTTTTRTMLAAMAARKLTPSAIGIDRRVRLLKHRDPQIRRLAAKLFGGAVSANRREVANRYRPALTRTASVAAGFKVFQKSCAKCHKVDGKGHNVGPDISDVRNRSREALLYDILDPNLKVEPRFTDYVVATSDGRVYNGLMISETPAAIVLRQPEGKQQVIARADIERIRAGGKSLMPEGVEKEITVQQMADLLEYLKNRPLNKPQ
ncbi:MAG: HEAT repeat domain-containing protein, partial [Planctomycetaceae bacterium]